MVICNDVLPVVDEVVHSLYIEALFYFRERSVKYMEERDGEKQHRPPYQNAEQNM